MIPRTGSSLADREADDHVQGCQRNQQAVADGPGPDVAATGRAADHCKAAHGKPDDRNGPETLSHAPNVRAGEAPMHRTMAALRRTSGGRPTQSSTSANVCYVMLSRRARVCRAVSVHHENVAGTHRPAQSLDLQLSDGFHVDQLFDHGDGALAQQDLVRSGL